jgi:hypothetical protein
LSEELMIVLHGRGHARHPPVLPGLWSTSSSRTPRAGGLTSFLWSRATAGSPPICSTGRGLGVLGWRGAIRVGQPAEGALGADNGLRADTGLGAETGLRADTALGAETRVSEVMALSGRGWAGSTWATVGATAGATAAVASGSGVRVTPWVASSSVLAVVARVEALPVTAVRAGSASPALDGAAANAAPVPRPRMPMVPVMIHVLRVFMGCSFGRAARCGLLLW